VSARLAPKSQKPPRQNPAVEEGTKFQFNEVRDRTVTLLLPDKESFELFGDDPVQNALFGMTRCVFKRGALHAQ
jgi:hypothetical protein